MNNYGKLTLLIFSKYHIYIDVKQMHQYLDYS
jgi:hypothetical protein